LKGLGGKRPIDFNEKNPPKKRGQKQEEGAGINIETAKKRTQARGRKR